MRIFLGGSREASAAGLLRRVASWVEDCGHKPLRWDEPGAFPAGSYTFARLREVARSVDGAIFIFSEDDKVWYRTDTLSQPRDNVLLEYGLFSDALGERRVAICRSGNPKTATDLLGITCINLADMGYSRAEMHIAEWLETLAVPPDPRSILLEQLASPFQASGKMSLFLKGTELVNSAKRRLALVAKTPIVLIGPRPYDGSGPALLYENRRYEAYSDLIRRTTAGGALEFLCVASMPCMLEELSKYRQTLLPIQLRDRYIDIDKRSSTSDPRSRMTFGWHQNLAPMTFLVSDDDFMIWFKDGSGESVWITANNEVVAGALHSQAKAIAQHLALEDVLNSFDSLVQKGVA